MEDELNGIFTQDFLTKAQNRQEQAMTIWLLDCPRQSLFDSGKHDLQKSCLTLQVQILLEAFTNLTIQVTTSIKGNILLLTDH